MATNISRSFFISATTGSTVPFLYHTRTLTPLASSFRTQHNSRNPRLYSTQNTFPKDDDAPDVNTSQSENEFNQVSPESSIASSSTNNDTSKPRRSFLQKRAASVSSRRPLGPRPVSPANNTKKIAPKITTHEKLIFGDLLEKLGVKHDGLKAKIGTQTKPLSAEKQAEMTELVSMFDSLLQDPQKKRAALKALKRQRWEEANPKSKPAKLEKPKPEEEEVPEEPKGPRKIKLSDLGYVEAATANALDATVSVERAIEMVVERESEHIEFALFQAVEEGKGDMGVWEVCKERIFSMLHHLDETSLAQPSKVGLDTSEQAEAPTRPSGPLRIPDVVPASSVVAALYPKTLLVVFRLLNTHFPRSPLIGQFHSTIKEHGRISALLGASSGLYDELIFYQWRVCKDLPAVIGIMHEMNQLGVNPSSKCRGLLTSLIIRQQRDLEEHQKSTDGKEFFWDLPSNKEALDQLTRKGGWMDQIKARAEEEKWQREINRQFRG